MKTAVSINSDLKERIPSIFLNLLNQMKEAGVNNDCIQTPGSQPWQKLFWMRLLQLFTSPYGKFKISWVITNTKHILTFLKATI